MPRPSDASANSRTHRARAPPPHRLRLAAPPGPVIIRQRAGTAASARVASQSRALPGGRVTGRAAKQKSLINSGRRAGGGGGPGASGGFGSLTCPHSAAARGGGGGGSASGGEGRRQVCNRRTWLKKLITAKHLCFAPLAADFMETLVQMACVQYAIKNIFKDRTVAMVE